MILIVCDRKSYCGGEWWPTMVDNWVEMKKKCLSLSKLVQTLRERNIKPNLIECQMYFSWSTNVFLLASKCISYKEYLHLTSLLKVQPFWEGKYIVSNKSALARSSSFSVILKTLGCFVTENYIYYILHNHVFCCWWSGCGNLYG